MSIIALSDQNFVLHGQQRKNLGINLRGNILVYFKMGKDGNCQAFDPIFAQLAKVDKRIKFAVLDVEIYPKVVQLSRSTVQTQINAVPSLVLYIDGKPHAKCSGTKNVKSLQAFITAALKGNANTQQGQTQTFMPQNSHQGYNPQTQNAGRLPQGGGHSWKPEIGKPPSLKGVVKGYAVGNNVEEEEEMKLMIPDQVVPHNTPWEAAFLDDDEMN